MVVRAFHNLDPAVLEGLVAYHGLAWDLEVQEPLADEEEEACHGLAWNLGVQVVPEPLVDEELAAYDLVQEVQVVRLYPCLGQVDRQIQALSCRTP